HRRRWPRHAGDRLGGLAGLGFKRLESTYRKGRAMTEAAPPYVQSLKKPIPVLACHQHFLSDIGKDLLEEGHHQLRDGFRQIRLLPRLRAFVRQQGRHLGESIGMGREALDHWLTAKGHTPALPKGVEGIAAVRSMPQCVLDSLVA